MKTIIHDLGGAYDPLLRNKCESIISANGKYAPCQGCFGCWTKHPAQCYMKDTLQMACRLIGASDSLVIITENCYGSYSPAVKNVLDRSIGVSTPLSTYRDKQMHHTLRYGKKEKLIVYVYGDMTSDEEGTFRYMAERNAINYGFREFELRYLSTLYELEGLEI
jgi:multimeric flavodoxin WrbA